jgi:hypothetical protein
MRSRSSPKPFARVSATSATSLSRRNTLNVIQKLSPPSRISPLTASAEPDSSGMRKDETFRKLTPLAARRSSCRGSASCFAA